MQIQTQIEKQSVLLAWALVEYMAACGDRADSQLRCCMCAILLLRSCGAPSWC